MGFLEQEVHTNQLGFQDFQERERLTRCSRRVSFLITGNNLIQCTALCSGLRLGCCCANQQIPEPVCMELNIKPSTGCLGEAVSLAAVLSSREAWGGSSENMPPLFFPKTLSEKKFHA